jgi:hypothetical protein
MKIETEFKENHLTLTINDKVVRDLDVQPNTPYNFKYNKEDCYFILEQKYNKPILYLYPINMFSPNKLVL